MKRGKFRGRFFYLLTWKISYMYRIKLLTISAVGKELEDIELLFLFWWGGGRSKSPLIHSLISFLIKGSCWMKTKLISYPESFGCDTRVPALVFYWCQIWQHKVLLNRVWFAWEFCLWVRSFQIRVREQDSCNTAVHVTSSWKFKYDFTYHPPEMKLKWTNRS